MEHEFLVPTVYDSDEHGKSYILNTSPMVDLYQMV